MERILGRFGAGAALLLRSVLALQSQAGCFETTRLGGFDCFGRDSGKGIPADLPEALSKPEEKAGKASQPVANCEDAGGDVFLLRHSRHDDGRTLPSAPMIVSGRPCRRWPRGVEARSRPRTVRLAVDLLTPRAAAMAV